MDHGDWWFNLRPSNTEPLLRLNLEAGSADEVAARVAEVQAVMAGADTAGTPGSAGSANGAGSAGSS